MLERNILIEKLKGIKEDDYKVPQDENPMELALNMLNYIGDTDGYLRDTLIYSILANWIINNVFESKELYQIFTKLIDENHLFYKIGEKNDSVFTRTFSVLIIAVLLYVHRKDNFLSQEDIKKIKQKLINYLEEEQDVRGYVNKKGWAHGVAHAADALDELAQCNEISSEDLKQILQAILYKMTINNYVYINEEDERMVTAVENIIKRNLVKESEIISWINEFKNIEKLGKMPEDMLLRVNTKNFLRSLYFRLIDKKEYNELSKAIKEVLVSSNRFA